MWFYVALDFVVYVDLIVRVLRFWGGVLCLFSYEFCVASELLFIFVICQLCCRFRVVLFYLGNTIEENPVVGLRII